MLSLYIALVFFGAVHCAQQLNVPRIYADKAVYYLRVKQLDDYSCGYNVLFNACNLEQFFGITNPYSDYAKFNVLCSKHLKSIGQKPKSAASNQILEDLSAQLKLEDFYYLTITNDLGVAPIQALNVEIRWQGSISSAKKSDLFLQAKRNKLVQLIARIKQKLKNAHGAYAVHFGCHVVVREEHGILMSVIQFANKERALFICDNMNESITDRSDAKKHIDFLCETFDISKKSVRIALKQMPGDWPSLQKAPGKKRREAIYYYS